MTCTILLAFLGKETDFNLYLILETLIKAANRNHS